MFGLNRIVVAQNERALVYKNRSLVDIKGPGVYWLANFRKRIRYVIYDLTEPAFTHDQEDIFLAENAELMARNFAVESLGENEVGLVYRNDQLRDVLAPAKRYLYWKGPVDIRVERLTLADDLAVPEALVSALTMPRNAQLLTAARQFVQPVEVLNENRGLLFVDGEFIRELAPGRYAYFRFNRKAKVEQLDTRVQLMDVTGQEILTRDKVSLRVNLAAQYQVTDPVLARTSSANFATTLYGIAQFALRTAVGNRTLDELLGSKSELDVQIQRMVTEPARELGLEVKNVGVKDVILPGEMKDILNQVVQAEKSAQANVIKRREETAATRSLLNTAKLMGENPILLRLKELETLEKVTEKVDKLTVFGGLDGVLQDTVRINLDSR